MKNGDCCPDRGMPHGDFVSIVRPQIRHFQMGINDLFGPRQVHMNDYYHKNYQAFWERTVSIDPSPFLDPFINVLPTGASILDIGCGSGRDLLWAKNKGFAPTGFEKSPGLAALARKHSGCSVIEGDFETFNFSALSFDAILASGSFVHIPHSRLAAAIQNVTRALSPNGWFYISHKNGSGTKTDDTGRMFYLWQDKALRRIFDALGFWVVYCSLGESVANSKDMWLGYVLKQDITDKS